MFCGVCGMDCGKKPKCSFCGNSIPKALLITKEDIQDYKKSSKAYHDQLCNRKDFEIVDNVLIGYHGRSDFVMIPDGVETISYKFLFGNSKVKKVYIPDSVTAIEGSKKLNVGAFFNCQELESVRASSNSSLKKVDDYAFAFCPKLRTLELPQSLNCDSKACFGSNPSLRQQFVSRR